MLAKFLRAIGKGWAFAERQSRQGGRASWSRNSRTSIAADERDALDVDAAVLLRREDAQTEGWGTMDPAVWQDQINLYAELGQFSKRTPKLEEVMTLDILKMTADSRPKVG